MAIYAYVLNDAGTIDSSLILRKADSAVIPIDPDNSDGADYLAWCKAGNVPDNPLETKPSRRALGSALRDALKAQGWDSAWNTALLTQSEDTRAWWVSGYRDYIPIDASKIKRIAAACTPPVDLNALYTAANA